MRKLERKTVKTSVDFVNPAPASTDFVCFCKSRSSCCGRRSPCHGGGGGVCGPSEVMEVILSWMVSSMDAVSFERTEFIHTCSNFDVRFSERFRPRYVLRARRAFIIVAFLVFFVDAFAAPFSRAQISAVWFPCARSSCARLSSAEMSCATGVGVIDLGRHSFELHLSSARRPEL